MRKLNGVYSQFTPNLTIMDAAIPPVKINDGFTYLGKYFDFFMDIESTKKKLIQRLTDFLRTTSALKVEAQLKLKILRFYISSQFSSDLRICNISYTWLEQNLDSLILSAVNSWLEMPSNTCSKEFLELPRSQGGHEIWLLSTAAMKLRLSLRQNLRMNRNKDLNKIWELT